MHINNKKLDQYKLMNGYNETETVYTRRFSPRNRAPPTVLAAPFHLVFLSSLSP